MCPVQTVFKASTLRGQSRVKCALPLGKSQAPCVVCSLGNVGPALNGPSLMGERWLMKEGRPNLPGWWMPGMAGENWRGAPERAEPTRD